MELLQLKNLSFTYPESESPALDDISLSIKEGEFAVLCGESGCGKSTLLRLIKKEVAPFGKLQGEILYNGADIKSLDSRVSAQEIGFVSQDVEGQIVTDTVWHELAFGLESLGLDTSTVRRRVAEMACYFGIEEWFDKKCEALSGGMKQLLNLSSVMVMQPKILLLDEPCAQLDPIAASEFITTLSKLNRELGLTVLLVEHRLEEVFPIADRVFIMEGGKLQFADKPQKAAEFFEQRPKHPLLGGLPAAMRIYNLLGFSGESPVSVRQGREFLEESYQNNIKSLEAEEETAFGEVALELKGLWYRYSKEQKDVLRDFTLVAHKGEHLCILGGNGAGKTTALNIMSGLQKPYKGKVLIKGKRLREHSANSFFANGVAQLPQNPLTVFVEKTLGEDLYEAGRLLGKSAEEARIQAEEVARELEISYLLSRHPYDLSGGEQQKAALARILISEPEILLLDEPTKGIDAGAKSSLAKIIGRLKSRGVTVVTVTHDVEFAAEVADRCLLLFAGETVSEASPVKFFSENSFYTTSANRISRGLFENAVLCSQVAELCKINGRRW